MDYRTHHSADLGGWELVARQHGVVEHRQLLEVGLHPQAIKHRLATNRLHPLMRSVYAVGRPDVTQHGRWMAALLCCGDGAVLSPLAAAALWGIRPSALVEVSVRADSARRHRGIKVHRRLALRVGEIAE